METQMQDANAKYNGNTKRYTMEIQSDPQWKYKAFHNRNTKCSTMETQMQDAKAKYTAI